MVVCFDVAVGIDEGEADDTVGSGPADVAAVWVEARMGGREEGRVRSSVNIFRVHAIVT